jgi:hypothetical protein
MKKFLFVLMFVLLAGHAGLQAQTNNKALAAEILADKRLDDIQKRALILLNGFSAGTSYSEIWIRDFNTFIKGSLKVHPKEKVKEMLLLFFKYRAMTAILLMVWLM